MYGIKSGNQFVASFDGNGNTRWTADPLLAKKFQNRSFAASCIESGEKLIVWVGSDKYRIVPASELELAY